MESGQIVPNLLVMLVTFLFAAFFVACELLWCKVVQVPWKK